MHLIETLPGYRESDIKICKLNGGNDVSPFGAFPVGEKVEVCVEFPATVGAHGFYAVFYDDDRRLHFTLSFKRDFDCSHERYTLSLPTEKEALYFYRIYYRTQSSTRVLKNPISERDEFQLTVYDKEYRAPQWFAGGTMYHIFVDRFFRGGDEPPKPYAKMAQDMRATPQFPEYPGAPLANDMFFGGDLPGVTAKLDYLKALGVSCIYLSPIFDAKSNHKYDTGNYMEVDSMFGGDKALDELLTQAHSRGMRVILDGVFNHTGDDSLYFNKYANYPGVGAHQSPDSPYYDWYDFHSYPDSYNCWWGIPILPTVEKDSSFREYIFGEDGVVPHYIRRGIDGWRLDVADELPEEFLVPLTASAKKEKADALILGEVWEDASSKIAYERRRKYFRGHELDSVMNYPWRSAVISFMQNGGGEELKRSVLTLYENYPKCISDNLMNFLGTHDTPRILTVLAGDSAEGHTNAELADMRMTDEQRQRGIRALKCAYGIIATLPGVPCIYYGDEAGMEGYSDPFNRRFYPWGDEDTDLRDFYGKIGEIRRTHQEAFAHGIITFTQVGQNHAVYTREDITVAVNRGTESVHVDIPHPMTDLITGELFSGQIPPMSIIIAK